ncbi:sensor histidine kinase [Sporichthya brevicatena]|uniref:histidine kinase n=1 Tax=Sporichthya brevicatena TaxID=171442 RepID=A0ABN1GWT4_9ACTN
MNASNGAAVTAPRPGAYGRGVDQCRRRPPALDILLTVPLMVFVLAGTAGAASGQDDALRGIDVGGFLLASLAALPFVFRRVAPVPAAVASATAVAVYTASGYAFGPVLIALAIVTASMAASLPLSRSIPPGVLLLAIVTTGLVVRFAREPDDSATVGLIVGPTWLVVPFAIGVVVGQRHEVRLRTRREEADRAVDAERLRIAAEVHDVAGHGLAVIAMQAGVALHVLDRKPEQARIALEEIRAASTEALDGLRTTLDTLRAADAPLTPGLPGLADLPALAERIGRAGVAVDLTTTGQAGAVSPAVDHAAYRIVQESLTNVLRHADAHRVRVTTTWTPGELRLAVADDGTGTPGPEGGGIGGMRARAAAVGGTLTAGPAAGGGFTVTAVLPAGLPAQEPR